MSDRLNELLGALGEQVGAEMQLDETGECVLEHESGAECVINAAPEGTGFTLSAVVGAVYVSDGAPFLTRLLQLNGDPDNTHGGSLSLDPGGDIIVYRYISDADGLDAKALGTLIENFFAVAESLGDEIEELRSGAEKAKPAPSGPVDEPGIIRG